MTFNYVQSFPNDELGTVVFTGSSAGAYTLGDAHATPGIKVVLKNQGTGVVTVSTSNSQTIDGASTYQLVNQYQEVTFQSDGTNWMVIAHVASVASTVAIAPVNLTAQAAAINATTLYAAPAAGMYRVSVDGIVTTVGTAGTLGITIASNNGVAALSQTSGTANLTVLGAEISTEFTLYSAAGQNITYATALAGATGTPAYALRIRVSYLG
jgi:uncharacterized protein (DUF1684 family)